MTIVIDFKQKDQDKTKLKHFKTSIRIVKMV
jgi:hypothetical protein